MPKISNIHAHKVLNSRGNWTINTEVELDDGSKGHGEIPEGASKGGYEAVSLAPELAIDIINHSLGPNFCGLEASNQAGIDARLIELDNTSDKHRLGENTMLSVSIAVAKAVAHSEKKSLYTYLSEAFGVPKTSIPTPLFNVINGGKHAKNNLSFQEFIVVPEKSLSYDKALDIGVKTYQNLKLILEERGYGSDVGDEGGFSPQNLNTSSAFGLISEAIKLSGFNLYKDVFLGLDAASNSFFRNDTYNLLEERLILSSDKLLDYYGVLKEKFSLIYLEDPFSEDDIKGWAAFNKKYKKSTLVVGDDLTVTNMGRLEKALHERCNNAVIVKPNQIGTLSETYQFVKEAKELGMAVIVSHRSGEVVVDTFIADFAVAVGADYIKAGAPAHERVAKYNKLLEIYGELNNIEGFCNLGIKTL